MRIKQLFIYNYLLHNCDRFVSPTEIGRAYGVYRFNGTPPLWYHSAIASRTCLKFVNDGIVQRNKKGHYLFIKPY